MNDPRALTLLSAFSAAFSGTQVAALGRDIVEPFLHHPVIQYREVAVDVLARWGEDNYGFVEMLGDWFDREPEEPLQDYIETALASFGYFDPEVGDCPDCGEGDLEDQGQALVCTVCGSEWFEDTEDCDVDDEEDAEVPRPELVPWQQVCEQAQNHLHSAVCTGQLPGLLESLVGVHPHLTLDLIESYKIGHLSTRATNLNLFLGPYSEDGVYPRMYFWSETYAGTLHRLTTNDSDAPERWALELQWK